MKRQDFFLLASLIVIFFAWGFSGPGCQTQERIGPLCGAWKMVSGSYRGPDFQVNCSENDRICYKVLSRDHFAVVEIFPDNPDSMLFTAVGKYHLTDSLYVEEYEATNVPYKTGTSMTFKYKLENSRWIIETREKDMELYEEWERVKKESE